MHSVRRDHILNEIVHSGIDRYHHKQNILLLSNSLKPQLSVFCAETREVKQKSLFFSYYFREIIFNSSLYQ